MKQWPGLYHCKQWGYVYVREHTDNECTKFRKKGTHQSPISMGVVCLYNTAEQYIAWAGTAWAEKKLKKVAN